MLTTEPGDVRCGSRHNLLGGVTEDEDKENPPVTRDVTWVSFNGLAVSKPLVLQALKCQSSASQTLNNKRFLCMFI